MMLKATGDRAIAEDALARLGIAHLADRLYPELSGGERQMVLIARALAQQAAPIVMDEPTASLDFGNQARVLRRIAGLAEAGLAIVLSTHDPGHAFACADRVALTKEGRIVATGSPIEVVTPEWLETLYGVTVAIAYLDAAGRHVCAPALSHPRKGASP